MNEPRLARTTKEIRARHLGTIPVGTEFWVTRVGRNPDYSNCKGLVVTSIWNDEFEFIPDLKRIEADRERLIGATNDI